MQQFMHFCLVGALGFVIDSACFILLETLLQQPMLSRGISFWIAATATWLGNNFITWRQPTPTFNMRKWCLYMLSCHVSGVLNLLVFWLCLGTLPMFIGFCLGIGAGLLSNYFLSRQLIFSNQGVLSLKTFFRHSA